MVLSFFNKFSSKYEQRLLSHCCNTNPSTATSSTTTTTTTLTTDTQASATTTTTTTQNSRHIDGWNQDAVHHLVRKLKKNPNVIEQLDIALRDKSPKSKCVLISKTPHKRLLISHRRALPQVIYCRLWRWPDLQSHHQIKAIPTCLSSVRSNHGVEQPLRSNLVCINPYHYDKTNPKPIEPVQVPFSRCPPEQISTSFEDSDMSGSGTKARAPQYPPTFSASLRSSTSLMMPQQHHHQQQQQPQQQQQQQQQPLQQIILQTNQPHPAQMAHHSPQRQHPQQQAPIPIVPPPPPTPQHQHHYQQHYIQQQQPHQLQTQPPPPPPTFQVEQHQYVQQGQHQYEQTSYQQQPSSEHFHQQQSPQMYQSAQDQYQIAQSPVYQSPYQTLPPQRELEQQQQQYSHQSPTHSSQTMTSQRVTTSGEVARPYRFKQPKFGLLARARHEHSASNLPPRYDPHDYQAHSYSYMTHSPNQMPPDQIMSPVQQQSTQIQPPLITQQQPSPEQQPQPSPPQPPMQGQFLKPEYARSMHTHSPSTSYALSAQHLQYAPQLMVSSSSHANTYAQSQPTYSLGTEQAMQFDQPSDQMNIYYGEPMAQSDQTMIDIQEVPYIEGTSWCSISYHEYDQRIGDKFHSNCWRVVSVDGYTQPLCTDRFCIGGISNINRNQFTEWVRRRIGRGVRLTYVDGEVYVEGLSEASVYVSSPLLAEEHGEVIKEHVSKLTHGCSAKVFSTQDFQKLLASAVSKGFEAVYKLTRACVIRVSFVKGWGPKYKRNLIYHTPCWVEVQLNGPLQWIDKVLRQMRPPTGCGSTS